MTLTRPIDRILDLARWAPSGDNVQNWRFEILGARHVVVRGFDTRDHCVYDLDGRPSQISLGALLETASIAACAEGWRMHASRRPGLPDTQPTFDLRFEPEANLARDPLVDAIRKRSVQRRPMALRPLTDGEKQSLTAAVGAGFDVQWIEGWSGRRAMAGLLFRSAKLRLVMPEAYRVHRDVIEWNSRYSTERVPDQALGVDRATARLMRFVMKSWPRVRFFNRFMAGTWIPRLQMDVLPALACAAHFVIIAREPPQTIDDWVLAGRAMQRLWLTVAQLDLVLQPEVTPLVFARYARMRVNFSTTPGMFERACSIAKRLEAVIGSIGAARGVFMGRIGAGPQPVSRSLRRELPELLVRL